MEKLSIKAQHAKKSLAETEDLPKVVHVEGEILAEDEDSIHIYKTEGQGPSYVEKYSQHPQKLKHPKGGVNSCLLNVLGGHRNLIILFL